MPAQPLPHFLKHSDLVVLNENLQNKTGCFAFLNPHPLFISEENRTYRDLFVLLSIGLYIVYHDFGCKYLNFFLDDNVCPSTLPLPHKPKKHKEVICQTLRPAVAHGLLGEGAKKSFWNEIARYYIQTQPLTQKNWSEHIDTVTENQWKEATDRLRHDADDFYDFLMEWGDKNCIDLRLKFAQSPEFQRSIDRRVCETILKENGIYKKDELNKYFSRSAAKPKSNMDNWQHTLSEAYRRGDIKTADSLYDRLCELVKSDVSRSRSSKISSLKAAEKYGFTVPF